MRLRGVSSIVSFIISAVLLFSIPGFAFAQHKVQVNGYSIDVKGQMPSVPKDLEPEDEQQADGGLGRAKDIKPKKWIVQFAGPVHETEKKKLADTGCRLGDYLPDFAFIVSMDGNTRAKVEKLPFVSGVVRYKPAYKIRQALKDDSGAVKVEKGRKIKLQLKLDDEESRAQVLSKVLNKNGSILDMSGDVLGIEINQEDIAEFSRIEGVLSIDEVGETKLHNDTSKWTIQSYVTNSTPIWDKGLHGEGQIVGIADTGLDYDMPWFIDPYSPVVFGPQHRKVVGYDSTYSYGDRLDSYGHGTHVAGIVSGDQGPINGIDNSNGMAPKSKLFISDISPADNGLYPPYDLGLLFISAYDAGARLHNDSWGSYGNSYNARSSSVDRFMWDHKDFLAIISNGNSGDVDGSLSAGTVGNPADAKNIVSVGASLNGTQAEGMPYWSSHGPTADGRIKPTVVAPGYNIVSADSDGDPNTYNSGTLVMSGTSMSAPTTAGAAALIRQYYFDGFYPGGEANQANAFNPTSALVKATLINCAQSMSGIFAYNYPIPPIPSNAHGWGRINLSNTLAFTGDSKTLEVRENNTGLATGESWSESFSVAGDQPLKATLVWTDYPGTAGAAKAIVNDLDLSVTAPDGSTTYLGNVFDNGESVAGGSADRINVEEQVLINAPAYGAYTISVNAYNIPNGPQPFALVITGASGVTSKETIRLNKHRYNLPNVVQIIVADKGLNTDSSSIQEFYVTIKSTSETAGELVRLVETAPDSAIFIGTIPLRLGAPVSNNGLLDVVGGDTISVTYADADNGTGTPATVTATAIIDIIPPVITGITPSTISDTSANITWTTNEPANSYINYGETTALSAQSTLPSLVSAHSVPLTGLKEGQTYYYAVVSYDEAGNFTLDNNGGANYTFTTAKLPPTFNIYTDVNPETDHQLVDVFGTVRDPSGVKSVTVTPDSGIAKQCSLQTYDRYNCWVPINMGANSLTITAIDMLDTAGSFTINITRLPPPDLVGTALSSDTTSVVSGQTMSITDTVRNQGQFAAAGFNVNYYLSTDNVITTSDTLIGSRSISSLAVGAENSATTVVTLPAVDSGQYYLGMIVDGNNNVVEMDETNNSFAGNQITNTRLYADLVGTVLSSDPASVVSGQTLTITDTVSNQGQFAAAGFNVNYYLSTDNVISTADTLIGSRSISGLAVGAQNSASTAIMMPVLNSGQYYIGMIVDSGNSIPETDKTNNSFAGNQIANTWLGADLIGTALSFSPASIVSGQTLTITDTVKNQGAATVPGFYVNYYFSTDNVITTADTYIGRRYISGLAAGGESPATTTISLPVIDSGQYYVGMIVDAENSVTESDKTNNALTAGNQITNTRAYPDLIGTMLTIDKTIVTTDQGVTVTCRVKNQGLVAATGVTAAIYMSTDNVITTSDKQFVIRDYYVGFGNLAAGAEATATAYLTVPKVPSGQYYIGMIIDQDNTVVESDETNNAFAGSQIITNTGLYPDLIGTALSYDRTSYTPYQTMIITDTVKNQGTAAADMSNIYYIMVSDSYPAPDIFLGGRYSTNLGIGAENTATTAVQANYYRPGFYHVRMIVDYSGWVAESDETNNIIDGNRIFIGTDTTPPTGSILINNGATVTNNPAVTLTLNATDTLSGVTQVQFSNDNVTWSTAEAYATTKNWTLPAGNGSKTVYVKFRDFVGNWSIAYPSSITLAANQPPVFSPTSIAKPNATVNVAYTGQTLAGAATDPEGDAIAYSKVSGPAWLTVAANGALSGTPTTAANDSFVVRATATGGSADATLNIIVTAPVNQPPAFSPPSITKPNATVNVAYAGQTLSGAATDPEGDAITYSKVSGPAWLTVASNGTLSGTPTTAATDTFTVRATATGGTADATLTITVDAAPTGVTQINNWTNLYSAAPGNTSASNLAAGSFTVGTGSDRLLMVAVALEIGTAATPTISATYGGTALTQLKLNNNTQREIIWVGYLKESQIGTGSKALAITYSGATGNASALHVKWAAFSNVNQISPFASFGGQNTATTSATFANTINYVINGMTTVVAANGGTPATATLSATPAFTAGTAETSNAQTSTTFTTAMHTASGSYASSTAVNWSGTTSSRSALVVASLQPAGPNQAPSFTINPITKSNATVGVAYSGQTLSGSATDPEGDTITFSKISGPAWLTVASNGALSGTPTTIAADSFVVRATATGGSADATLNISVTTAPVNQPPAFTSNPITKANATVGVAYSGQTLAGSASDPEGDTITYSKVSGPAWLTVSSNGALSGTPTTAANDSFVVRATATGGSADATLNLTVTAAATGVAQQNSWINLYSAAPNNTSASNLAAGNITVGTGSNRLLLVAVAMEIGTAANPTISATFGGTALTQVKITNNTQREIVWVGYLKESQIGSGSKALTITYSGATGNATALHVKWAAFSGVNQTTPLAGSGGQNTATTSATFGSTINYVVNGMTTVVSANGGTPATGALSATPAFTAGTAETTNAQSSTTFTIARHTASGSYASSTAVNWSGTTSSRSAVVAVSLQP